MVGGGGLVGGGGVSVSLLGLWGVDWGALVGDISDESVGVVGGVGGGLDPAVGKSNHEATRDEAVGILSVCLLEVCLPVIISHTVLVSIRLGGKLLAYIRSIRGSISGRSSSKSCGDESRGEDDL